MPRYRHTVFVPWAEILRSLDWEFRYFHAMYKDEVLNARLALLRGIPDRFCLSQSDACTHAFRAIHRAQNCNKLRSFLGYHQVDYDDIDVMMDYCYEYLGKRKSPLSGDRLATDPDQEAYSKHTL